MKSLVWSALTYKNKAQTLEQYETEQLKATMILKLEKTIKRSWVERKTNKQVLQSMNEKRFLLNSIMRKIKLIKHAMRRNIFMKNIFEGKISGNRAQSRRRQCYFKYVYQKINVNFYGK